MHQERPDADRIQRSQPGQSAPVRADRERAEDREEPDRLGLARADRLSQDRRPAGARAVAAAPGAAPGPGLRVPPGGGRRPRAAPAAGIIRKTPLPGPARARDSLIQVGADLGRY